MELGGCVIATWQRGAAAGHQRALAMWCTGPPLMRLQERQQRAGRQRWALQLPMPRVSAEGGPVAELTI
eukprot:Skav208540  [mRNA]  locus=scaffold1216:299405:301513:+ [translate_table: standard]